MLRPRNSVPAYLHRAFNISVMIKLSISVIPTAGMAAVVQYSVLGGIRGGLAFALILRVASDKAPLWSWC